MRVATANITDFGLVKGKMYIVTEAELDCYSVELPTNHVIVIAKSHFNLGQALSTSLLQSMQFHIQCLEEQLS